jgi:thiol-disulfide isomerase/thioredoxin
VVELTADNFDTITSEGDWIVEFYAPWCIHCQRLAPHLEKAAAQLAGTRGAFVGRVPLPSPPPSSPLV